MAARFEGKVVFADSMTLPNSKHPMIYPKRTMSEGPTPIFRDSATIAKWAPPDHGLQTLAFVDIAVYWAFVGPQPFKKLSDGAWQFQGLPLAFTAEVLVYVDQKLAPDAPAQKHYKQRSLALDVILSHEYDHVLDEIDVMSTLLPKTLENHKDVRRLLIDDAGTGQPARLSQADYEAWFVKPEGTVNRGGSERPDEVPCTRFDGLMWDLHAKEYNRLLKITDSDTRHYGVGLALSDLKWGRKAKWPL